jgi:hypothetical protein
VVKSLFDGTFWRVDGDAGPEAISRSRKVAAALRH